MLELALLVLLSTALWILVSTKKVRLRVRLRSFAAIASIALIMSLQFSGFASGNMIPTLPINHVYIRSNGNIEPSTSPITAHNNVYTLTDDLTNTTLKIERDGITIDGAGHSITGHSTSYQEGIDISNRTNVTIKNVVINQFGVGVLMQNAQSNSLTANKISTFSAFMLDNSDNNYIANNTSTQGYGIYGSGSNNQILSNSFSGGLSGGGNGMGILLTGSHNTISYNTVIHGVGIELYCQNSTISYNTVLNGYAGLLLLRATNNLVYGNIIRNITTDSQTIEAQAFYLSDGSTNNTIFENTFENNAVAVALGAQVVDSVWNNVYNNAFYRNNFVNNTQSVWIAPGAPSNFWDNGQQGNYWSNFQGFDSNADGISESSYEINSNNTDHHPLIAPLNFSNQEPQQISPTTAPSSSPTPNGTPSPTSTPSWLTVDLADGNYLSDVSMGEAVHFSAVVADGVPPYTYQWYYRPYYVGSAVGDLYPTGNTTEGANTQDFSFTPNATGHYLITVRVWDSSGAEGYFMSLPPGIWVNAQEATPTQSPTPVPSPTIPEFSSATLQAAFLAIATLLGAIILRRKQKTKANNSLP